MPARVRRVLLARGRGAAPPHPGRPRRMAWSARRDDACRLRADHFCAQVLAMLAAIFIGEAHLDAVDTSLEISGKTRDPDVRAQLRLGPRLLGGLIAGEH